MDPLMRRDLVIADNDESYALWIQNCDLDLKKGRGVVSVSKRCTASSASGAVFVFGMTCSSNNPLLVLRARICFWSVLFLVTNIS